MVNPPMRCAAIFVLMSTQAAIAQSPRDQMFPNADSCYARAYTKAHLAKHPGQQVVGISVSRTREVDEPNLGLYLTLQLRGVPGGFQAYAACENEAGHLYCTMEGDAGGFQIDPAEDGAILLSVSSLGMSFENDNGFATLERSEGDDRSFLMRPAVCH